MFRPAQVIFGLRNCLKRHEKIDLIYVVLVKK